MLSYINNNSTFTSLVCKVCYIIIAANLLFKQEMFVELRKTFYNKKRTI